MSKLDSLGFRTKNIDESVDITDQWNVVWTYYDAGNAVRVEFGYCSLDNNISGPLNIHNTEKFLLNMNQYTKVLCDDRITVNGKSRPAGVRTWFKNLVLYETDLTVIFRRFENNVYRTDSKLQFGNQTRRTGVFTPIIDMQMLKDTLSPSNISVLGSLIYRKQSSKESEASESGVLVSITDTSAMQLDNAGKHAKCK